MSLESLGALRQLVQVREQSQTIQNDNLEKVQSAVQQTGTAEAQRTDQLHLEKAKATYEVALAQATVERIQSQLDREVKAANNAAIGIAITGVLAGADSIMNLNKDLKGGQKLKDSNSGSGVDAIGKGNSRVLGNESSISDSNIYIGSKANTVKKNESVTTGVFKGDGKVDEEKAIKAGLITRGADGSLSATKLGQDNGFSVTASQDQNGQMVYSVNSSGKTADGKTDINKDTRFVDQDMAIKYGMAIRNADGGLVTTDKGANYGLGKAGEAMSSKATDGLDINMKSETILRATTSGDKAQIAYFSAATISEDDVKFKAEQLKLKDPTLDITNVKSFEDLMNLKNSKGEYVGKKAAEDLFNERGHDIKGVEAVDAQNAFKSAVTDKAGDEKDKIDKTSKTDESKKSSKTGIDNRVKEMTSSLEDKLTTEGKTNMGISGKDKAKYVWNALVSFADTVVPQIQAYMAARDRVEKTAIELAAAMEKLAAAQKKLKSLEELIVSVGAGDGLGVGNNQAEKGL